MPRRKKPQGRPPVPMPTIPDTFENILKAVLTPRDRRTSAASRPSRK